MSAEHPGRQENTLVKEEITQLLSSRVNHLQGKMRLARDPDGYRAETTNQFRQRTLKEIQAAQQALVELSAPTCSVVRACQIASTSLKATHPIEGRIVGLARAKLQKIQTLRDQLSAEERSVAELHSMFFAVSGRSLSDILTLRPTSHVTEDLSDYVDPDGDTDQLDLAWAAVDGAWLADSPTREEADDIW
ncbi:hypothetical protein [Deinococcus sp. RM]|uniref:hypothetical protein n=1 Tax=Deinococcus sp. RM TaxID=2316359 RepID=UPI0011C23AF5|nr:hypothetical protein [Deinococcus sp. RM]